MVRYHHLFGSGRMVPYDVPIVGACVDGAGGRVGNSNLPLVVKCALQPGILRFATDPYFRTALCNNP
jgi:hypothetical protein